MSTIFNYSDLKDVVSKESSMLPGYKSRVSNVDVIIAKPSSVTKDLYDGMVVKLVNGKVEPLAANDKAEDVFGIIVSDTRAQRKGSSFGFGTAQFIEGYVRGTTVSVMQKGFIYVPVQDAIPTAGKQVYIRNAADATNNRPIGGIESASATGNVALTGAYFTGNYGYPLTSKQLGTTSAGGLTALTAEIAIDFSLRA